MSSLICEQLMHRWLIRSMWKYDVSVVCILQRLAPCIDNFFLLIANIGCMADEKRSAVARWQAVRKQSSGKLFVSGMQGQPGDFWRQRNRRGVLTPSYLRGDSASALRAPDGSVLCGARGTSGMPVSKLSWRERASDCVRVAHRFALWTPPPRVWMWVVRVVCHIIR
jgi:hypothetical protein